MESGIVKTTGAEIYYQTHGAPCRGGGARRRRQSRSLVRQIDAPARTNCVIWFDHRGFGLSRDLAMLDRQIVSFNAVDRHNLTGHFAGRPAANPASKGGPVHSNTTGYAPVEGQA